MRRSALFLFALTVAGCAASRPVSDGGTPGPLAVSYDVLDAGDAADPAMTAVIAPYAAQLRATMDEVVAVASFEIGKGGMESALGNLASDAMLAETNRILAAADEPLADLAVGNAGGLRVPLPAGPVTVGKVYELMPFENFLVVQEHTAAQIDSLAQQLARAGGEPVAGISFAIGPGASAVGIEVGGAPLDPARAYRVATHNYLAYGGGDMAALWEPVSRRELPLSLRQAFLDYFARLGTLAPQLDGRIRAAVPDPDPDE